VVCSGSSGAAVCACAFLVSGFGVRTGTGSALKLVADARVGAEVLRTLCCYWCCEVLVMVVSGLRICA